MFGFGKKKKEAVDSEIRLRGNSEYKTNSEAFDKEHKEFFLTEDERYTNAFSPFYPFGFWMNRMVALVRHLEARVVELEKKEKI